MGERFLFSLFHNDSEDSVYNLVTVGETLALCIITLFVTYIGIWRKCNELDEVGLGKSQY